MAIRNFKLGGIDWISTTEATAEDLNDTFNAAFNLKQFSKQAGMGMIRQAIAITTVYSVNGTDGVAEAYIDADGRNNTVITASTDAVFDTDKYKADGTDDSSIIQNIPANILPSSIDSIGFTVIYEDKEDDDDVRIRLYNGTTSSGWYSPDKPASSVEFPEPPRFVEIELLPRSSSPVSGSPSIKGVYFLAQD